MTLKVYETSWKIRSHALLKCCCGAFLCDVWLQVVSYFHKSFFVVVGLRFFFFILNENIDTIKLHNYRMNTDINFYYYQLCYEIKIQLPKYAPERRPEPSTGTF